MFGTALLEAMLRQLATGVALWSVDESGDARGVRLLAANVAASRAVLACSHDVIARVAKSGVAEPFGGGGRIVPLPDRCVAVFADDAAANRSAAEDARRLTTFLDSIVENIPAMVFVKDAEALRYQLFNRGAERLTGRRREDVLGRNAHEVGLPPEQARFFEEKDREVLREGVLVDIPEEPVRTGDGEGRWLHTKKIPILDAEGRPLYLLGISLDVTDAKVATEALKRAHEELERRVVERTADLVAANTALREQMEERQRAQEALASAEAQLRQSQKMEAVGRLAGGIAHDFNNLLTVIVGAASMLADGGTLDPEAAQELDEIRRAGERAADLTRQLLAFSRQQVRKPTSLDLNTVIGGMERMLRRVIGEDIDLATVQGGGLSAIEADAGQIEQVIMNLVVNARDAMPDGGRLRLETANILVDEAFARDHVHAGLTPGPHVMLSVTDTGVGIDLLTQEKIFEPFFTTKGPGKGTGLGLPTVFGIVRQSGGAIFVDSRVGGGATFRMYFPRSDAAAATAHAPVTGEVTGGGSETILLVEDDDQVRALVSRILKRSGYRVLEAGRPNEALALAAASGEPIHLLVTDVVMPHLNGRQLAERVRALRPDVEVLFMSGYSDHLLDRDGVLELGLNFLAKPVTPSALTRTVRAILDDKKG